MARPVPSSPLVTAPVVAAPVEPVVTPTPSVAPASPAPPPRLIPQTLLIDLQPRWNEVAQAAMRDQQPLVAGALTGSRPVSFANGTLTIECPADFCDRADSDPVLIQTIAALVAQVCGHRLTIRVRPPAGMDGGRSARYSAAEAHPLVQALRKRFQADIITREPITRDEWLKRSQAPTAENPSQGADGAVPGV